MIPPSSNSSEPLLLEITYPSFEDPGPFPAVIILHTSGGWGSVDQVIPRFVDEGYAVYSPDFFTTFGITPQTRIDTFHKFREPIEKGLTGIVEAMKQDPKVDNKNRTKSQKSSKNNRKPYKKRSDDVFVGENLQHLGELEKEKNLFGN